MEQNGVNYYKGVLLCSRPNQSPSIPKQKAFCARVTPSQSLGLVPCKKFDQHQVRKRVLPVLSNHKKWLEGFKKKIVQKKQSEQQQKKREIQKLQKIKQQGTKRRQTFKKSSSIEYNQSNNFSPQKNETCGEVTNEIDGKSQQVFKQQKRKAKKGQKPGWAKTAQQRQAQQEKQVDDLLNFFDTNDVGEYMGDQYITNMLKQLKERIEVMKSQTKQGDWKKKQMQRIQQAKNQQQNNEKKDDILSRISRNNQAKSVASQKTVQRVQQLQKKKQQQEWDRNTVTDKKSHAASVDMQIAKNVADEVLRNYPALKHHSNQSIRKLLQKQAHQQIKA